MSFSDSSKIQRYYKIQPSNSVCKGCRQTEENIQELSEIEKSLLGLE